MLVFNLHRRAIWSIWFMAVLFMMTPLTAFAANAVGKILFVHGNVEIYNTTGVKRSALKDGEVFKGDRVITSAASSLQIQMSDMGYFAVRPNSEFVINEYIFNQSESDRVETSIIRGGLRSITGAIGQKNKKAFKLKTPVATIGIRGTDLVAFYLSPQMASPALGQQGSYLTIQSGAGVLETAAGAQVVAPGQAAYVASANLAPTSISQLPGIFQQPTFEEIIPGVNDQQNQEEAKEEPKEEEKQEEEEQQEEEQKEEEQNDDESSDDEGKFEFKAHAYLGKGKSSYVLQNYDLGDDDATNLYLPMLLVKETPYEEYGASLTSLEAGFGGVFRPISVLEIYGNLSLRNQAVDTDVNVEHTDTNYDISGGRFNFGAALNLSDVLKVWIDAKAEGYDNSSDHFYDVNDLYSNYSQRYNANATADASFAAMPAYSADRVQLGASLDVGPVVGVFGMMSFNRSEWDAVTYDGNFNFQYARQGVYMDVVEGGIRLNPVLIPIDFYASTIFGDFGSEGDDQYRYFDGSVKGVKGRFVLNEGGVFSVFGSMALLNFEGNGGYYNPIYSGGEPQNGSFSIDNSVRQAMAGVELRFTDYLMLQGFAQAAQSVDNANPDEKDRGAGAFELRIRAEL